MNLTERDKNKLAHYNNALKAVIRNQMANASDFETNINCLKSIAHIYDGYFLTICAYQQRLKDKANKHKFISRLFHKNPGKQVAELQLIEHNARSILFDNDLFELKRSAFSDKVVTGLNVYINHSDSGIFIRGVSFDIKQFDIIYEIKFSDGTLAQWYDMDDEEQLNRVKKIFEQKAKNSKSTNRIDYFSELDDQELRSCLIY